VQKVQLESIMRLKIPLDRFPLSRFPAFRSDLDRSRAETFVFRVKKKQKETQKKRQNYVDFCWIDNHGATAQL